MKVTVLGSGAMATACSILLAEHPDQQVSMWARNPEYAKRIQQTRENTRLLPGVPDIPRFSVAGAAATVRVRVLHRRFWAAMIDARRWPDRDLVVIDRVVELAR